jgi:hypothetical protein
LPVAGSQRRTVRSKPPEASVLRSGLNPTSATKIGVSGQRLATQSSGSGVPESYGLVETARGEDVPFRVEGDRHDEVAVALERAATRRAGHRVPESHRSVMAPRRQCLPIAAKGDGVHGFGVAPKWTASLGSGCRVPQANRLVAPGRGYRLAVGAERHVPDFTAMTAESRVLFTRRGVAQAHDTVE